ncbi:helix-turn-helix DNA binding domain protein [Arthrobacter phage Zucker]|nr:helix-turn-helix DNA binding domain protein [Arthrobacter phage Zucker]
MVMPSGKQPAPGPFARRFSAHVRAVMMERDVTALALAKATGMSRNYLGKRLRDEAPFTLNDVEEISKALELQLPEL